MKKRKQLMLIVGVCILCAVFFRACKLVETVFDWRMFQVSSKGQTIEVSLWKNPENEVSYLFLPSFCREGATGKIRTEGYATVFWDGQRIGKNGKINNLSAGEHELRVKGECIPITIIYSENIPSLFLSTQSGSLEWIEETKGNCESGYYRMISPDGKGLGMGKLDEIKSRGNVTFYEKKKPYQISLEKPADLLKSGSAKNYILLANSLDTSMLRNKIVFQAAKEMQLPYTPSEQHVDLYINGEYRGTYQLAEKVEVAENRIDFSEKERTYLLQLEIGLRLKEENDYFISAENQGVVLKYPKKPTKEEMEEAEAVFQRMEDGIRTGNLSESGIDTDSFKKKYILEEICKNLDAMNTSQYFFATIDRGGNACVFAGPVWDYDKSLGNCQIENTGSYDLQNPRGFYAATQQEMGDFWYHIYQIPQFRAEVLKYYNDEAAPIMWNVAAVKIDNYGQELASSAHMNAIRWSIYDLETCIDDRSFSETYNRELSQIKIFLQKILQYLNEIWIM